MKLNQMHKIMIIGLTLAVIYVLIGTTFAQFSSSQFYSRPNEVWKLTDKSISFIPPPKGDSNGVNVKYEEPIISGNSISGRVDLTYSHPPTSYYMADKLTWTDIPSVLKPGTITNVTFTISAPQANCGKCNAGAGVNVYLAGLDEHVDEFVLGWNLSDTTLQPQSKVFGWMVLPGRKGDKMGYRINYAFTIGTDTWQASAQYNYTYQQNVTQTVTNNSQRNNTPTENLSDLSIDNKYICVGEINKTFSAYPSERTKFYSMREPSADKQSIGVIVFNKGKNESKNVHVQFYVQYPGQDKYSPLGDPILVGDIQGGGHGCASTYWDLGGKNVEGADLLAQVYIPGEKDLNPDDNSAGVHLNIYYANKDDRAFSWFDDTYSFKNYGLSGSETEELIEGFLATLVGNMGSDQMSEFSNAIKIQKGLAGTFATATGLQTNQELLHRIIFPQSYIQLRDYFNNSMRAGVGGHCYGMSATSALYFEDPSLKPVNKLVKEMTLEEASANIAIYHRAQMLPLYGTLLTGGAEYFSRNEGPAKCFQAVKDSLRDDRRPLIIEFFGKIGNNWAGHAVLGYKLIEIEGRDPFVYVYDSNFNATGVGPTSPMPQITLDVSKNTWRNPAYMGYNWAEAEYISAQIPRRTIPLDDVNAIVPSLKKSIYDYVNLLKNLHKYVVEARCPADALFTDSQGRRTGTLNGQVINEIPGADILSSDAVNTYRLPSGDRYSVALTGTGQGQLGFDVIRADGDLAELASFENLSLKTGTQITGDLEPGGQIDTLKSGSETVNPSLVGSMNITSFGPVTEAPAKSSLNAGTKFPNSNKVGTETASNTLPSPSNSASYGGNEIVSTGSNYTGPETNAQGVPNTINTQCTQNAVICDKPPCLYCPEHLGDIAPPNSDLIYEVLSPKSNSTNPPIANTFKLDTSCTITCIATYHSQGNAPGQIGLQASSGVVYGPWQADGRPGSFGNVVWVAYMNQLLPPGSYTITDSDKSTWLYDPSYCIASEGICPSKGICQVYAARLVPEGTGRNDQEKCHTDQATGQIICNGTNSSGVTGNHVTAIAPTSTIPGVNNTPATLNISSPAIVNIYINTTQQPNGPNLNILNPATNNSNNPPARATEPYTRQIKGYVKYLGGNVVRTGVDVNLQELFNGNIFDISSAVSSRQDGSFKITYSSDQLYNPDNPHLILQAFSEGKPFSDPVDNFGGLNDIVQLICSPHQAD